jgi:small subunit ribosomal protein S16
MGRRKRPFYRIVAIDSRKRRDGAEIERLGWYDPLKTDVIIELKEDRIIHWLNKGAQASETVDNILKENGLKYRLHLMKEGKKEDEIENLIAEWQINQEKKRARVLEKKEAKKIAVVKAKKAEVEAEIVTCAECGASFELVKDSNGFGLKPAQSLLHTQRMLQFHLQLHHQEPLCLHHIQDN